jgi:hypothetical protein
MLPAPGAIDAAVAPEVVQTRGTWLAKFPIDPS